MYEVWGISAQDAVGSEHIEFVMEYLFACDNWSEACRWANLCHATVMLNSSGAGIDERLAA